MKEYQQRVVEEKKELEGKLSRLLAFLSGNAVKELPLRERILLELQASVMEQYSSILAKRIADFK